MLAQVRAASEGLGGARRILVYGVTGSGKTTLAARLGELTGVGWVAVDDETWLPGWVQRSEEEQRERFTEVCARDAWILDNAYGIWADVPLSRTQLVVGLDYARHVSLGRLLRRTAGRIADRREICNGNVETLREALSRDSIVAWHFRSYRRKHERLLAWEADPDRPPVLRLRTPAQTEAWLATVARG
jgi:adenylate kinase family enzyme